MTIYTLFGRPASPAAINPDPTSYTFGVQFSVSAPVSGLAFIDFWSPPTAVAVPDTIALFAVSGQSLVHQESASWSGAAGSGWIRAAFTAPPALTMGASYKAAVFQSGSLVWYGSTAAFWDTGPGSGGITNGPLSAPNSSGGDGGQDTFNVAALAYPLSSFQATNYWLDPGVLVSSGSLLLAEGII